MTGPKRRLVSAPGGSDGDDRKHDGFDDLHRLGNSVLTLLLVFTEVMGSLNVGTPSFRHCSISLALPLRLGRGQLSSQLIYASTAPCVGPSLFQYKMSLKEEAVSNTR